MEPDRFSACSARPLLGVALAYAAGILMGRWFDAPVTGLAVVASAFLLAAWAAPQARLLLITAWLVAAGWLNLLVQTRHPHPNDLRCLAGERPEWITLRARLRSSPEVRESSSHGRFFQRTVAEIQVEALRQASGWRPARGCVLASTPGLLDPTLFEGRSVEIQGVLTPPPGPAAPGLFDYRQHLADRGIHYLLRTEEPGHWRWLQRSDDPTQPPLRDRFLHWGQATLARGLPTEDAALRLQWAMVLGWKTTLTDEVSEPFMRSGTMHIFAISGLHIALIAILLTQLLRVLRVPRRWCGLIVLPAIWFYTGATGWQASAVRSTIMMTLVLGGWSLQRPVDPINSLAAAAFLILLGDPAQLFQASFQLSFFVVLGLALFMPSFTALCDRWLEADPLLPRSLQPGWHGHLRKSARWLLISAATSLVAWLGSLPLVALYFNLLTPVSLLANLIVVPLSSAALACGLGSIICAPWCGMLTEWFNHSGWLWMSAMVNASEWAASLPGGWLPIASPSPIAIAAYYVLLVGLGSGGWFSARYRHLIAALFTALVVVCAGQFRSRRQDVALTFFALRGGDSLVFESPASSGTIVIDTGPVSTTEPLVSRWLRARGFGQLPLLILTHGDARHAGGTEALLERVAVDTIVATPARSRSQVYRDALTLAELQGAQLRRASRGTRLGPWEVLHPAAFDKFTQADDQVMVLRARLYGLRVLLCSDLGLLGQRTLLERESDLRADLLVAGMPDRAEPLSETLVAAVQPRVIVVSTGEYPAHQLPSRALRLRLERHRIPVLFLHETGTVQLIVRPDGWQLTTMDGTTFGARTEVTKDRP